MRRRVVLHRRNLPSDVERRLFTIVDAVAEVFNVPTGLVLGLRRDHAIAQARHVAMYIARDQVSVPLVDLAAFFGRHYSALIHATKNVENWREYDRAFQSSFEAAVRRVGTGLHVGAGYKR